MATTKIWNGTAWVDLVGPQGPAGPTVVSTDAGQLAKLGSDGKLLVAQADLDARYVNVTGDTMTGPLTVERDGTSGASSFVCNAYADAGNSVVTLRKTRGTKAAQTPCVNGDFVGRLNFSTITTTGVAQVANLNCSVRGTPTATGAETFFSFAVTKPDGLQVIAATLDQSGISTSGSVAAKSAAINWVTPTRNLEVAGTAIVRGTLEVTDNITSTGTSHAFAANSIPATAIYGLPIKVEVVTQAAYTALAAKDPTTLYLISG